MSALGVVAGLGFQVLLGARFGLAAESDAFFVAYTIPLALYAVLTAVQQVLISAFARVLASEGRRRAHRFVDTVASSTVMVLLAVSGLLWVGAPILVQLLGPGLADSTSNQAADVLRIMAFVPALSGLSLVTSAFLAANERFLAFGAQNLVRYTTTALVAYFGKSLGLEAFAWGLLCGAAVQCVLTLLASGLQLGFVPRPAVPRQSERLLELFRTIWAASKAMGLRQITPWSNRVAASFLPAGSLTLVEFAGRLQGPATTVFFGSVVAANLPGISTSIAEGDDDETLSRFKAAFRQIGMVSIVVTVLLVVTNESLLRVLYQWGDFDGDDVSRLVPLALIYNAGLLFRGYVSLVTNFFYPTEARRELMRYTIWLTIADVVLKSVLVWAFGIIGIAIAFSLSMAVTLPLGFRYVSRLLKRPWREVLSLPPTWLLVGGCIATAAGVVAHEATTEIYTSGSVLMQSIVALAVSGTVSVAALGLGFAVFALRNRRALAPAG